MKDYDRQEGRALLLVNVSEDHCDFILACFGFDSKAKRRAWREKMGLLSLILYIMAFVGFVTFGFTQAVCFSQALRNVSTLASGGFSVQKVRTKVLHSGVTVRIASVRPWKKVLVMAGS